MNEGRRRRRRGGRGGQGGGEAQRREPPGPPADDQRPPDRPAPRREPRRDRPAPATGGPAGRSRSRDGGDRRPREWQPPVPQDERSKELGAQFREAQTAIRDARKTLDKRRAELGDEPEWLTSALAEAEQRFAEAATAWQEHLANTGRKVVRG